MEQKKRRRYPSIDSGAYGQVCSCYTDYVGADPDCPLCSGTGYRYIKLIRPKKSYL